MSLLMNSETEIFNFNSPAASGEWRTVDDVVMGGISNSKFIINPDSTATFSGTVSPDNNGGFASFRGSLKKVYKNFKDPFFD